MRKFARSFRSFKDKMRESKRANDMYADLAGKPRLDYSEYNLDRPKHAPPIRDESRITEAHVNDSIRDFSANRDDLVLWRNNRGMIDLPGGGKLRYGVGPNGASDWIGYRRVKITQEMVGSTIAQFIACEAKAPDAPPTPAHQEAFLRAVRAGGGVGFVARSVQDVQQSLPISTPASEAQNREARSPDGAIVKAITGS